MAIKIPAASYANPAEPTYAELAARVALLDRLRSNEDSIVKVTEKGSLSMYGLGKFPVTLTLTQWMVVAKQLPKLFVFAAANFAKLFFKSDEQRDAAKAHVAAA